MLLLFVGATYGQGQFSYGLHVGMTNSDLTNIVDESEESVEGIKDELKRPNTLMVGVVLGYNLSANLAVIAEVNYLSKGLKNTVKGTASLFGIPYVVDLKNKVLFQSIEIPVMVRYKFGDNIKFYANVGPYFNIIMNGRSTSKGTSTLGTEFTNVDNDLKIILGDTPDDYTGEDAYSNGRINRLDIGAYIGFGAAKELGPGSVVLDLRYGIGFTDLNNFEDADKPDDYKASKFNNLTFSLGYVMNF